MLRMVSYPHRPQSGHIMCYLHRTYHVLPTWLYGLLDSLETGAHDVHRFTFTNGFVPLATRHFARVNAHGFGGKDADQDEIASVNRVSAFHLPWFVAAGSCG